MSSFVNNLEFLSAQCNLEDEQTAEEVKRVDEGNSPSTMKAEPQIRSYQGSVRKGAAMDSPLR